MTNAMLKRPGIVSLAFILSVPCPSTMAQPGGAGTASVPYEKLSGFQDAFLAIPEIQRDKISFAWTVTHVDPANHAPIRMWLAGTRTQIPIAADGTIALPVRPDWRVQHAILQTDQPHHVLQTKAQLLIRPPASQSIPAAYLIDAVAQAQNATRVGARQMAGILALLAVPNLRVVHVTLPGCCAQTLRFDGSGVVLKQNASGVVIVALATLQAHATETLVPSAPILKFDPDTE